MTKTFKYKRREHSGKKKNKVWIPIKYSEREIRRKIKNPKNEHKKIKNDVELRPSLLLSKERKKKILLPELIESPHYRTCFGCFKKTNAGKSNFWYYYDCAYIVWSCSNRCERNVYFKTKIGKTGITCCHCSNVSLDDSLEIPCLFCKKRNRDPVFVGFQKKSKKYLKEYRWLEEELHGLPNEIKEIDL